MTHNSYKIFYGTYYTITFIKKWYHSSTIHSPNCLSISDDVGANWKMSKGNT